MAPLPSSAVFLSDLSRALPIPHRIDTLQLANYAEGQTGGVRLLKDLDQAIEGRHVVVVEDVVDTGLTLNFLARTLSIRQPESLVAVTLLDRPYRRLVDGMPLRYVGFTVPDGSSPAMASGSTSAGGRWRSSATSSPRRFRPPQPRPSDRAGKNTGRPVRSGRPSGDEEARGPQNRSPLL